MMRRLNEGQRLVGLFLVVLTVLAVLPASAFADAGVDMYRLYNRWTGEHFYTASSSERDSLRNVGWTYEGTGWVAPTNGAAVYRLYNPYVPGGDHHYTTSWEEYQTLQTLGWRDEGIGWWSGGSIPVYRQYNPFALTGTHNYTTDSNERNTLVGLGWRDEGAGWYAVGYGTPVAQPTPPSTSTPSNPGGSGSSGGSGSTQPQVQTVYWTPGGSKYHSTRNCPTLKRSKVINSGSVADALRAGKKGPCKDCF